MENYAFGNRHDHAHAIAITGAGWLVYEHVIIGEAMVC